MDCLVHRLTLTDNIKELVIYLIIKIIKNRPKILEVCHKLSIGNSSDLTSL